MTDSFSRNEPTEASAPAATGVPRPLWRGLAGLVPEACDACDVRLVVDGVAWDVSAGPRQVAVRDPGDRTVVVDAADLLGDDAPDVDTRTTGADGPRERDPVVTGSVTCRWFRAPEPARVDRARMAAYRMFLALERDHLVGRLESAHHSVLHLNRALETSRSIGAAVGIVMSRRKLTSELAFDLLRRSSQASNQKLVEVAEQVVLTGDLVVADPRLRRAGHPRGDQPQGVAW